MRKYAVLIVLALAPAACSSGHASATEEPCIVAGAALPYVQLAAPASGATNVPTAAGTLIYASSGIVDDIDLAPVAASDSSSGAKLALKPAPLPSTLPSPLATPAYAGETYFAASYPALRSDTSYEIGAFEPDPCGPAPAFEQLSGTFTTR